ncbi:MAG: hypothetical protein FJ040_09430 [Chloroflexi bacterium]|nr:hypothetical protein [Chloroflexota bacterium]
MPAGVTSFATISAGKYHTCALTSAGVAYCWGRNEYGELGDGSSITRVLPVLVSMPAGVTSFATISAGMIHTCARTNAGVAYCWGRNDRGQLGDGTLVPYRNRPVAVIKPATLLASFVSIVAGADHTCGLTSARAVYCWGRNEYGELGDGSTTNHNRPVAVRWPVGIKLFAQVTAGGRHTCALTNADVAYCWGANNSGQVGDGTTTNRSRPVAVRMPVGVTSFASISSVGGGHTCARTRAGVAYCWGANGAGQLGDGSTTHRPTPVTVRMP